MAHGPCVMVWRRRLRATPAGRRTNRRAGGSPPAPRDEEPPAWPAAAEECRGVIDRPSAPALGAEHERIDSRSMRSCLVLEGADAVLGGQLHLLELGVFDLLGGGQGYVAVQLAEALLDGAMLRGQPAQQIFCGRTNLHSLHRLPPGCEETTAAL